MERKLKELIGDVLTLKEDEVIDSLAMKDVEVWDSLRHMELVVSIEQMFGIELSYDEIVAMQTFKDIKRVLGERGLMSNNGSN